MEVANTFDQGTIIDIRDIITHRVLKYRIRRILPFKGY